MVLPFLARVRRASSPPASVNAPAHVPAPPTETSPQPPYGQRVLRLDHPSRPHSLDLERRLRRTAMRLALDGLVVAAGAGQAYSAGSLVLATAKAAA
ncbi:hypothetical protein G3I37_25290 [Streptomyces anulatus]|uniref:Uncharacterized protein n=1 Tax=Streptomyces anulatus TaxID=1892 RepID=A0A7K3RGA0_STRAQ|nr:hypothetical protein [Streptomyces anulatus]NEC01052.1 hypothetical protein [Streptomyces anulatus]NED28174.1 hypothetical protein [Streptomyces anulatus]